MSINWQSIIIAQIGETEDGALAAQFEAIWDSYAGRGPVLQPLLTKLRLVEVAQAKASALPTVTTLGTKIDRSARNAFLAKLHDDTDAEIQSVQASGTPGSAAPSSGAIAAVLPPEPAWVQRGLDRRALSGRVIRWPQ